MYSRVHADMRKHASTRACTSRAPLAPARECPGHASHVLTTHTRLSSYLCSVLYVCQEILMSAGKDPHAYNSRF